MSKPAVVTKASLCSTITAEQQAIKLRCLVIDGLLNALAAERSVHEERLKALGTAMSVFQASQAGIGNARDAQRGLQPVITEDAHRCTSGGDVHRGSEVD